MLHIRLFRTSPRSCLKLSNESGTALLFVIVLAVIGSIVISSAFFASRVTIEASGTRREKVAIVNIAEAGKEHVLGSLRNRDINPGPNQDIMIFTNRPFGSGAYSVRCITNAGIDTIKILSTGKLGADSVQIEVFAKMAPDPWMRWVKGAVNARTGVSTTGGIEIDGRDYDTVGNTGSPLPVGPGTYGVSACGTVTIGSAASSIGGNGVAPQNTTIPGTTVRENIDTAGYPQTPEQVLGLPAGALDAYKTTDCPSAGFSGIAYLEDGDKCDATGEGIYICHNSSGTATLKNYHGNWKGLIIADKVKHFNASSSVLGAVVMLGTETGGNCFGNGSAVIHYSSQMLGKALQSQSTGPRTVTVISWREVR